VLAIAAVVASGLLLSACGLISGKAPSAVQLTPSSTGAAGGTSAASAKPKPSASAGLRVSADIDLGALSSTAQPVAAEAPNGAVFYADGTVVMVVEGDKAPSTAEHAGAKVLGLGASATTLYIVTQRGLTGYSRSTGNQTGHWALSGSPGPATTAGVVVGGNGDVWVWTDWATDASGYEYGLLYAVLPGVKAADTVSKQVEPGTLTTDGTHAFFLAPNTNSSGASLVEATAETGGSQPVSVATVAPAPTQALVGFSHSQVILFAQPDSLYRFTPGSTSITVVSAHAGQAVWVAGTNDGLLFLTCGKQTCDTVSQVDQSTGKSKHSLTVRANSDILLGPDPAVLGVESDQLHLVRLS